MRVLDHDPIDPEIAAALDAIDATVAGEPVDARYAELAEIALLLAADRPQVPTEFACAMDARVERRFAPAPPPAPARAAASARSARRRWRGSVLWQSMGALTAGVALIVAIVLVTGGAHLGGGSSASSSSGAALSPSFASSGAAAVTSTAAPSRASAAASAKSAASATSSASPTAAATATPSTTTPSTATPSAVTAPPLQPPTSGRKIVQSAQLNLTASPNRIDAVAQQVYDVVGQVNGIVNSSTITQGGPNGYASFQLSVPSASLGQTMTRLSSLNYAQVVSSTNNTQDITDQYNATTTALADARALRTSLLKQLANAVTTEQVNSLTAQIHDAEASISSDLATLGKLNQQVNFSQLQLLINARPVPTPVAHKSGGFGIGRASHDAGRVLTVAAGGALIAIAALIPIALVVALAWWVGAAIRRRRREQALDSV
jgi:hypothetical protein